METTAASKRTKRKSTKTVRRRQPDEVRFRIMQASLDEFASYGFNGASVRSIAKQAHVSISLLIYHFKSKELLWEAVLTDVLGRISKVILVEQKAKSATATEELRSLVSRTVRFFAEYPSLHRLMTLEGHQLSDRLVWLCETYLKTFFESTCNLILQAQKEGSVIEGDPARIRLALTAIAAVPFAVSAEYQYLTKKNPFTRAEIQATIDLIEHLIFKHD